MYKYGLLKIVINITVMIMNLFVSCPIFGKSVYGLVLNISYTQATVFTSKASGLNKVVMSKIEQTWDN